MSYSPEQLEKIATNYEKLAAKTEKKKLNPKAKVRNRGTVCVPAESAKDKKDHFPINDEDQARNALARVNQYSSSPEWYKGSLEGLKSLVSRKVHTKYPSIGKSEKKSKKSSLQHIERMLTTYAQNQSVEEPLASYEPDPPLSNEPPAGMKWTVVNDERTLVPVSQPANKAWTGEKIDPTFQKMLGVSADGLLGRQTQHALNRYKQGRNPNMTNTLAYEYLKKEPEYASGTAMKYDDNSNTYVSSVKQASLEALMKRYG